MIIESFFIIGLAMVLDFKFGDPKNKYHPTSWIGTLIAKLTPIAKNEHPTIEKFGGVCIVTITSGLVILLLFALNIGITLITIDYVSL
ncbi:MAG: cobalamin biosynthesis protein, partial [Nitrosopumilus sp.]|nr:cobalamin biosynthesis protein [Nitrosopumilus sp.]